MGGVVLIGAIVGIVFLVKKLRAREAVGDIQMNAPSEQKIGNPNDTINQLRGE